MVYSIGVAWEDSNHDARVVEPIGFDKKKIKVADATPDDDLYVILDRGARSGRRVRADGLPHVVRYRDPRPVPDYHTPNGVDMVSARFRDIVERLEPGVHQFEPVAYVDGKGRPLATMYAMFVCNRIDSVDRAHTTFVLDRFWQSDGRTHGRFVFNEAQIGGRHLWRDKFIPDGIFISGALAAELGQGGLSAFTLLAYESR